MATKDTLRDARNSIYKRVSDLLTSPPAASGVAAYTVYGEVQLRQAQAGTLTRVYPSAFLVDRAIRPVSTALPMVAVEVIISAEPFELGRDGGIGFYGSLHCFGRQKNEASLLAYHLMKNFRPLAIYDYGNPDALTLRETASLDPNLEVSAGPMLRDEERQQGAFDYWFIVSFRGSVRDV